VSSVVIVVKGTKVAQSLVKIVIQAAGACYGDETYTDQVPDSRCEPFCGWGHMENKCNRNSECGYCSGHHRISDHKCNVVG